MKNQFFYSRTTENKEFRDSLNINKIIRTVTHTDNNIIVILDDFNERVQDIPEVKKGKITGYKKVRQTVQSEIHLSPEDGERLFKLLNIEA
jgi:hypothetical protein